MPSSVHGLDESQRADEAIAARMQNLTPVLQVLAQDLRTLIDDSFDQSRSPMGQAWEPLTESTIMSRGGKRDRRRRRSALRRAQTQDRRKGSAGRVTSIAIDSFRANTKPLVDTGRLRNSISTRVRPKSIEFGTNTVYAAAQQFGTKDGRIPPRPFLPVTPTGDFGSAGPAGEFIASLDEAIAAYIETGAMPR